MTLSRIAALALAIAATSVGADAQGNPPGPHTGQMAPTPMHHPMDGMMAHGQAQPGAAPAEPGQAAFGAIQEIVRMLQSDQMTNWSKVDIDALRQHLIDMDEATCERMRKRSRSRTACA